MNIVNRGIRWDRVSTVAHSQSCTVNLTFLPFRRGIRFFLVPELELALGVDQTHVAIIPGASVACHTRSPVVARPASLPVPGVVVFPPKILLKGLVA